MRLRVPLLSLLLAAGPALAKTTAGFGLEVLVDGSARPEYASRGTVYVEALRGRDFSLRITNPLGVRVAVALAVDGLDTIDAKHGSAKDARKWVLAPYESVVIPGWQVSGETSRKFYFTGEKRSYGAQLGQTANLGTIEAVFFRERVLRRVGGWAEREKKEKISSSGREKDRDEEEISSNERGADAAGAAPAEPSLDGARDLSKNAGSSSLSDELAATGMGRRTRFDVTYVDLDLEDAPAASVRIRYEFRPQLVALGVLPPGTRDPIARREAARGFENYCPEPN